MITRPWALSIKVTVPKGPATPVALIELIVAVAVAVPAVRSQPKESFHEQIGPRLTSSETAYWNLLFCTSARR